MNAKTLAAIALLSLCACGAQVATDQSPSEAGVAARGPLQDAGALVIDATTAEADADLVCQGPNPVGCAGRVDACQPGFFCDTDPNHGCAPSVCICGAPDGWGCSTDCGGGVCRPVEDAGPTDADDEDAVDNDSGLHNCPVAPYASSANIPCFEPDGAIRPVHCPSPNPACGDAAANVDATPDAMPCCSFTVFHATCMVCADAEPFCCMGTPIACVPGVCPQRDH